MTKDKLLQIIEAYDDLFTRRFNEENREPKRFDPDAYTSALGDEEVERAHILWMLREMPSLLLQGRVEKTFRWLGFVQGWLWARGISTIGNVKQTTGQLQ